MFARSNIAITGGNFWQAEQVVETGFEKLQKASAPSAFHDSSDRFDPPKCHPNTRVAVLEYLMGWIYGRNDPEALILWLYGPAGAGKSAILQTIAEWCFDRKSILASFFFGRSDSTRNNFKPFIASIAYQITIAIPEIKPAIENAVERDPLIFDRSIATQFQCLIVEPLKDLAASGFFNDPGNCARLILIDGLDECKDPKMQKMILKVLANALHDQKLPLIFLIASRPEQHIALTFNSPPLVGLWRSLVLDDTFKPDDDILLFLDDSFEEIKSTHPQRHLIPEVWPKPSDFDKLIEKSSGQFIYASVVIKYVSVPDDRPPHRLEVIMGLRRTRGDVPFSELDALYMHILDSCSNPEPALFVLGIVVSGIISVIHDIEMLMDLERGEVEIVLAPLTSLINLYHNKSNRKSIQLCHASFGDFLVDISRSGRFHIDMATVKESIAIKCLQKLVNPYSITTQQVPAGTVLSFLWRCLKDALYDGPILEAVGNVLKDFSLPQFWSSWSPELGHYGVSEHDRIHFVIMFLHIVSGRENSAERDQIHALHLSSFESIFKYEVRRYYWDVGLMSLVVIALLDEAPYAKLIKFDIEKVHKILFRLTEGLMDFDRNSFLFAATWGPSGLLFGYRYLFTSSNTSAELYLDGYKQSQTALRILEFLFDHPPCPVPHQKHQPPKPHSPHNSASNKLSRHLPPRQLRKKWLSDIGLPRKRREEKHRRGVILSFRLPYHSTENLELVQMACELGLKYLLSILRQSSKSPELVDFIRTRGKDIVFIPKWTRKAIRAMYEYLERLEEDAAMVDLSAKFETMVIE